MSKNINFLECEVLEGSSNAGGRVVIKDINTNELFILHVFPNWNGYIPKKGDIGYIEFEYAEEGASMYYENNQMQRFKNTYFIFRTFVLKTETNNNKEIEI